ncbi:hypothetical protein BpsM61_00071 [Bacillus phage vB_BpsM-61]|nr:hypothetical protein BpsM61_00071 [Bacillus phage vB_BpsM-61]
MTKQEFFKMVEMKNQAVQEVEKFREGYEEIIWTGTQEEVEQAQDKMADLIEARKSIKREIVKVIREQSEETVKEWKAEYKVS